MWRQGLLHGATIFNSVDIAKIHPHFVCLQDTEGQKEIIMQTFLKRKQLGIKTNGTSFWENINAYSSIIKMSNYIYIKIRTLTFTY